MDFLNGLLILIIIFSIILLSYFIYVQIKSEKKSWFFILFISLILFYNLILLFRFFRSFQKTRIDEDKCDKIDPLDGLPDSIHEETIEEKEIMHDLSILPSERIRILPSEEKILESSEKSYLARLTNEVESPSFIASYLESMKKCLLAKKKFYHSRLQEIKHKVGNKAKKEGFEKFLASLEESTKKDNFQKTLTLLSNEIEDILSSIENRLRTLTPSKVKADLKEILENSTYGFPRLMEREDVKEHLSRQILSFCKNPYVFMNNFQNIVLYGSPGVGKTTCAHVMSFVYLKSGLLARNRRIDATKSDFNSSYVEETSINMRKIFLSHLEGIILLDEAYEITPKNNLVGISHGTQGITELCDLLSKWQGKSIFIAAGYEAEMPRFLDINEGMNRRFPHRLYLRDYSAQTLSQIFAKNIPKNIDLDPILLLSLIEYGVSRKAFKYQAGDIMNIANNYVTACSAEIDQTRKKNSEILLLVFQRYYLEKLGHNIKTTQK